MSTSSPDLQPGPAVVVVVEQEIRFSLLELGRACDADGGQLLTLVAEGVLSPSGEGEAQWSFDGSALRRARRALRLARDLELRLVDTALVLDLLDEIERLKSRLRRLGAGPG